ncbi:class I SAM-dependent methyltransferase [Microbacterium sp. G2-8]|uniref:class I SAM-dependent methyltransferase n=1 Tax=Microbacterium sp. G2-8 TaxID=2842454 RepID=UPI001C8AD8A0|nr:class I SAM-dependent methyltransferase [Microbacterium sp. G2-8]
MDPARVRDAYGRRAAEYVEALGSVEVMADADRTCIETWASGLDGRVLDIGSGPGHWSAHLHERGSLIEGVEPVREFLESARARFVGVEFREASVLEMPYDDGAARGVLAWYSLIHLDPDDVALALASIARVLAPGGSLLLGFFEGAEVATFDHAVATAYFWPITSMTDLLDSAGFAVVGVECRTDPGGRPQASIIARRHADTLAT